MAYLLDTGLLIHAARSSPAFQAIDSSLGLLAGGFQPVISIVSRGEVFAFAAKRNWGEAKLKLLRELIDKVVILPIDTPTLADAYADLEAKNELTGLNIGQNDLSIAAPAIE